MKKIISLVIAFMVFGTTALANTIDGFSEVWENYSQLKSYTGSTVMSVEVNEPLLFLEDIPVYDETIDLPLMVNDLLSSTATVDYSVSISDDYKKMQMAMSMACDVPVTVNEDLKLDAWARMGMWLEYDMTDPEAPIYKMIIKTPLNSKYQVMDMSAQTEGMAEMLTPEVVEATSDATLEIIKKYGEITRTKTGYRVKFDNDGMLGYLADIFKVAQMIAPDDTGIYDEIIPAIEGAKGNLKILGDDGLTLEITKNANGDITAEIEAVHFAFNIYDILTYFEQDTEGLDRERSDVNVTLKAETKISGHNATVVEIPELTEENSEFISDDDDSGFEGSPLFVNNEVYYPIEEICRHANGDFTAVYENGVLTIVNIEGNTVTVLGNTITMGESVWEMDVPQLAEAEGLLYVTEEVLDITGYSAYASYDTETKEFYFYSYANTYVYYPYPLEGPEITDPVELEEYIPPYLNEYVMSDQVPYVEDGEAFIPVYDLFKCMYRGDFTITADSLRYTATEENDYGIGEIFVKVGENSIMVDGEEVTFEKPVVNVANIFRAPLEFVENLGFTVERIWIYDGTSYELSMPNPNYIFE